MQPTLILSTLFAASVTGGVLALQHYLGLPWWHAKYKKPMPLIVRYVLGTAALQIAIIAALIGQPCLTWVDVMFAAITITAIGGSVTMLCHSADELTKRRAMRQHGRGG